MSTSSTSLQRQIYRVLYFVGIAAFLGACGLGFFYALSSTGHLPSIDLSATHAGYLRSLTGQGEYEQAINQVEVARQLEPYRLVDDLGAKAYGMLALGLMERGHRREAEMHFAAMFAELEKTPEFPHDDPELLDMLSRVMNMSDRISRKTPQQVFLVLNNLAWLRATHLDESIRNGQEAVKLAERADELTGSSNPTSLDVLAAAYAEVGNWGAAMRVARQAIQILEDANVDPQTVNELKARLSSYEQKQPYRDPSTASSVNSSP